MITPGQKALLVVVILFLATLLFYTAYDKKTKQLNFDNLAKVVTFQDPSFSLRELNKVAALLAIGLIAISFVLGPLSHMFPHLFCTHLPARKWIGIYGFILAILHSAYAIAVPFQSDLSKILGSPNVLALIYGLIALFILFIMAATSNQISMKKFGFKNWKLIQTAGYVALALAILHFVILETKPTIGLDIRPFGLIFLAIPLIALILRVLLPLFRYELNDSFHEQFGGHKETCPLPPTTPNNSTNEIMKK